MGVVSLTEEPLNITPGRFDAITLLSEPMQHKANLMNLPSTTHTNAGKTWQLGIRSQKW